jgi:hypothetical protein
MVFMKSKYISVDLRNEEKEAVLEKASFFITDEITNNDLLNKRKNGYNLDLMRYRR